MKTRNGKIAPSGFLHKQLDVTDRLSIVDSATNECQNPDEIGQPPEWVKIKSAGTRLQMTTRSSYWQCQGCGSIYVKQKDSLSELGLSMGMTVMGGRTCGTCGTRHETADIYNGNFDMHAPDVLVAAALQDTENAAWDATKKVWKYKGQELRGSESFESPRQKRPSNVRHIRSSDGKTDFSAVVVDKYHLDHADVSEVEELLGSIATQIRERGSFKPCILTFLGFDGDPREVCQIPEIRRWCSAAWKKSPALVPFIEQDVSGTCMMFILALLNAKVQLQGTKAAFAVPPHELTPILIKAAESGLAFLESCNYKNGSEYITAWVKSFVK